MKIAVWKQELVV